MATTYNMNNTYKANRSTFGGLIYNFDYDGHPSMCDIAARIVSDMKFDKKCKNYSENRKKVLTK